MHSIRNPTLLPTAKYGITKKLHTYIIYTILQKKSRGEPLDFTILFVFDFKNQLQNASERSRTSDNNNSHNTPPTARYLIQHIVPRITSIAARMKSMIFVGKHKASSSPAPNAAKIIPLLLTVERDIPRTPTSNSPDG